MRRDWILDVLADLKTFARSNDMPALAEQLDDTSIVAMAEIASLDGKAVDAENAQTGRVGHGIGSAGMRG
ncbi:MAG: hypothetical protein AAF218_00810 [Pseudomonadota bacterium]